MAIGESNALTVLLVGGDSVYYYKGNWKDAVSNRQVLLTGYSVQEGLGKIIRAQQKVLGKNKKELMILIKPLEASSYKNLVDILDEVMINKVEKYAIVPPQKEEVGFVAEAHLR